MKLQELLLVACLLAVEKMGRSWASKEWLRTWLLQEEADRLGDENTGNGSMGLARE